MSMTFDMPSDFMQNLLENTFDRVAPQMIDEAMPTLEKATKDAISSVIIHPVKIGLADSITSNKAKMTKTDAAIASAYPKGKIGDRVKWFYNDTHHWYHHTGKYRSSNVYEVTYGTIGVFLMLGVRGFAPRREIEKWPEKACSSCEDKVLEIMQKKYEELTK